MSAPLFPLQDQLCGFSRGLFSTWIYHRRFNILFDAGEGVASNLQNRVFGIRRIFLSHGHADHIAGLINLINIRNLGGGNQTAGLSIYYPRASKLIELVKNYLARTQKKLSFALDWIEIEPDATIALDDQKGKIFIRSFQTRHSQRNLSLGYNVIEIRRRLKPQYQEFAQSELCKIIKNKGKQEVAEEFEKIVFSYGGDSRPIDTQLVQGSLFLCHDCTYLSIEDDERRCRQHSHLDEVLEMAKQAEVKNLMLFHTSLRYNIGELRQRLKESFALIKPNCRVLVLCDAFMLDSASDWQKRIYIGNRPETEFKAI